MNPYTGMKIKSVHTGDRGTVLSSQNELWRVELKTSCGLVYRTWLKKSDMIVITNNKEVAV